MTHLERIKLDIHNNLTYEETDELQTYIESIQTPEWKRRKEELSDEELKAKFAQEDIMEGYAQDMQDDREVYDDDDGNTLSI